MQAPQTIIHITRVADGKPLAVAPEEIWYGRPVPQNCYAASLLHPRATAGDVPYLRVSGQKFAAEVRIESRLNAKAGRS